MFAAWSARLFSFVLRYLLVKALFECANVLPRIRKPCGDRSTADCFVFMSLEMGVE
jgi:hypothetical protein